MCMSERLSMFSTRFRKLRNEKGISQEQLSKQLGISAQAVSKWECAQAYPDIELLPAIADIMHVSIDYLLLGKKVPENSKLCRELDFPDDDILRIVQFKGREVLKKDNLDSKITIQFCAKDEESGDINTVEIWGNAWIEGDIYGNIKAGGMVNCGNVAGYVDAGGAVNCKNVAGYVDAGGLVNCRAVADYVDAGGDVVCADVAGDVDAGRDVKCADVGGNVDAGRNVECGDVDGDVDAGGNVECGDVDGNVDAGNDVKCENVSGDVSASGNIMCNSAETETDEDW